MKTKSKKAVNVLFIGHGARGKSLLPLLLEMEDVNVVGVSDVYEDRMKDAAEVVRKARGTAPAASQDYRSLLEIKGLDAMNAGLYAGTEVGGAVSIQQCWEMVRTSEKTGMPCMLMENCCYGREEMTILNMAKLGLFGELIHAEGGYRHDLRHEICKGRINRHYRLDNYLHRNGDVYPTHDLGPIAKYLDINRGNRMLYLTSVASKSCGNEAWVKEHLKEFPELKELENRDFAQGDVVVTTIKCAHGETITLFHDTSLPRPYSRGNLLQGTKGIWMEDKHGISAEGLTPVNEKSWNPHSWCDLEKFYPKYEHPLWKKFRNSGVKGGHGGMDFLVLRAFIQAVKNRTQTPIDVYDTAAWMSITALSEDSAAMGGHPVAIPDFTNGRWISREPAVEGTYCLEKVCKPGKVL